MGETVFDFRCQRARAVRLFRLDGETDGNYQSRRGRERQNDFPAKLDFQFSISAACRADQCVVDVRRQLYFAVAFPDVAFVSQADLHQSLVFEKR